MLDINHILVVLDSEHPEQIALTKAIWLAKKVEADLTLLSSVYEPYATEHSALDLETREKLHAAKTRGAEEWINSFVSEATEAGVRAVTRVIWAEHLEDAVTELLNQQDFDLVIKGTRHHSMMDHLFSHEDWELMNQTDAPVMLVKTAQPWQSNRILASVDATAVDAEHRRINENILEYAEHLSDHFETDLHLVNAYPQIALALAMVPEVTTPSDIQETIHKQHKEACEKLANKYNASTEHLHIHEGETAFTIKKVAQKIDADLVVVGSMGRTGLKRLLVGNTAEDLVDQVNCDLLVIKPLDGVKEETE